jgi:homoserine kinase
MLIPGFAEVKAAALASGALGCSISGSGPSMFALCASMDKAWSAGKSMQETFRRVGLECDLYVSGINRVGPVCLQRA